MQAINHSHQPRPGSARPGPIGLLIRMVLGAVAVYALVELVTKWDIFRDQNLIESDFWFVTVFTVCLLADVFNIALRRRSFPVAIATRTPGCEFNALPRLVARLRGTADEETRRCLLGVDLFDKQPMRRRGAVAEGTRLGRRATQDAERD